MKIPLMAISDCVDVNKMIMIFTFELSKLMKFISFHEFHTVCQDLAFISAYEQF
jgi:hypothetical protein